MVGDAGSATHRQLSSFVLQQRRKNPQETVYTVSSESWREGWLEIGVSISEETPPDPPNFSFGSNLIVAFKDFPPTFSFC